MRNRAVVKNPCRKKSSGFCLLLVLSAAKLLTLSLLLSLEGRKILAPHTLERGFPYT